MGGYKLVCSKMVVKSGGGTSFGCTSMVIRVVGVRVLGVPVW